MTSSKPLPVAVAALLVIAVTVTAVAVLGAGGPLLDGPTPEPTTAGPGSATDDPDPPGPGATTAAGTPESDGNDSVSLALPNATDLSTFASGAAFTEYVRAGRVRAGGVGPRPGVFVGGANATIGNDVAVSAEVQADSAGGEDAGGAGGGAGGAAAGPAPERVSGTNVQVEGIAEPDIVKTNGRTIYYAGARGRIGIPEPVPVEEETTGGGGASGGAAGPGVRPDRGNTSVIDALPPENVSVVGDINRSGDLLLANDTLVVIGNDAIAGYDVSTPAQPSLDWEQPLSDRVVTARLHDGSVYLVLASPVDADDPCPVEPMNATQVACSDVLHPREPIPVETTYTALVLDPDTGTIGDTVSFVGSRDSTVSMFANGLYVTYTRSTGADAELDFLLSAARDVLDPWVIDRLEAVRGYNLSERATRAEIDAVLRTWLTGLDDAAREQARKALAERYRAAFEERRFTPSTTNIVRIGLGGNATASGNETPEMTVSAVGAVPGRPLNQFSMDVHEGSLRIATTVGGFRGMAAVGMGDGGVGPAGGTENDVYVLDTRTMNVTGSVTGMGENQRVYAVRFVGEEGYVVTFRRTDPLHVLDLSDPAAPEEVGTLKLPGFSTYLHPLSEDRVLGIGEEDGRVKTVIFDVSDPTDPAIADSKVLDAEWSAVAESHHAFLLDREHGVFFLPTSRGGHLVNYTDGLSIEHTVDIQNPQRARYIDDHLYVFGSEAVAVVNETTWERTATVEIDG